MFITGQEQANSIEPEADSDTAVDGIHYNEESIKREYSRLMSKEIDYKVSLSRNSVVNIQESNNTNEDWTRTYSRGNLASVSQPENISIYSYQSVVDDSDNESSCDRADSCNSIQSIPESYATLGLVVIGSIGLALHHRNQRKDAPTGRLYCC